MKIVQNLLFSFLFLALVGCSSGDPEQLSFEDIEDLNSEEQVNSIVDNTDLIDDYHIVIEDNSLAVVYVADYIPDGKLVLDESNESFPNTAMILVEHLSVLDFEEIVVTSYDTTSDGEAGLTRVSSWFTSETIDSLDFNQWRDIKENNQHRFYNYPDDYLIRGMVWDSLDTETQNSIGEQRKNANNLENVFWGHYGSYVE